MATNQHANVVFRHPLGVLPSSNHRDAKTSNVSDNFQRLVLALNIADELMSETTGGKKPRAGDIARAKFILANVHVAVHRFSQESKEAFEVAVDLVEKINFDEAVSMLRDARVQFELAGDKVGVTDVNRYCKKYSVEL